MLMDETFLLPFDKKEQLTKDTFTFYFKRNGSEKPFIPGQYYEMTLPHDNMDERGDARVFTISSSPTNLDYVTVTTRILKSSFKRTLANLRQGEMVKFGGPWDDLNYDDSDNSPHVFFAGGIGITPYHSIVEYVQDKNIETSMILFVSWKTRDEMIFDEFFRNANNHLAKFTYVPTLTEENPDKSEWDGELGRIDENMIKKYVSEISVSKYYFSGPPAMVNALKNTVSGMGVPKEKIIFEEFEGY